MLIYFSGEFSPNCLKTKALLVEMGLEHEQRDVSRDELRGGALEERFPAAQLPAIEDDGVLLCESSAIALHLASKHDRLLPRDGAARALVFQAVALEAALLGPTIGGQGLFGEMGKPEAQRNQARIDELGAKAQKVAHVFARVLGSRDFFAGELSIADFQIWPGMHKALRHGVIEQPTDNLQAWDARVGELSSMKQAMAGYVHFR